MIDFRYHLVSIVAVFLALAVGLVIGATALKPKTEQYFDSQSRNEARQIGQLRTLNGIQLGQINADQAAAKANAPVLLDNLLAGQRVVLVTAPGADSATISGVTAALEQAGAKVTGQAALAASFFDTSAATENSLEMIANQVAPPGVTPGVNTGQGNPDPQIAGQTEAAQVLATALVTKNGSDLPASEAKPIIDKFVAQQYLQVNVAGGSAVLPQATLAVVITPASPPATDSDPSNLALLALAEQLSTWSHGVVLAGKLSGSGTGSAIDELNSGNSGLHMSSVDYADYEVGQIEVAQALNLLLTAGKVNSWGVRSGAAPAVSPTSTPTRSPATTKGGR